MVKYCGESLHILFKPLRQCRGNWLHLILHMFSNKLATSSILESYLELRDIVLQQVPVILRYLAFKYRSNDRH